MNKATSYWILTIVFWTFAALFHDPHLSPALGILGVGAVVLALVHAFIAIDEI